MWQTTFSQTPAESLGNEKCLPRFGWLKATYTDDALTWEYEQQLDCDNQEAVDAFTSTVAERFSKYVSDLVARAAEPKDDPMPKFLATMDDVLGKKTAEVLNVRSSGLVDAAVDRG